MKMLRILPALVAMAALASAQQTATIHSRSSLSVASTANMEHIPPAKLGLNRMDAQFLRQMAFVHIAEINLGRLAQQKGGEWSRAYGKDMEREHSLALEELKKLSAEKGETLPNDMDATHKKVYNRLSRMSAGGFDQAYRSLMIDGHKMVLNQVVDEIHGGRDAMVRSYAVEMETAVKLHAKMAREQTTMLGGNGG